MITCPCCKKSVPTLHKRSHVLPDWMCQQYYSQSPRKVIAVDVDSGDINPHAQSAVHGEYWCNTCENRSSRLDTYACDVLRLDNDLQRKRNGISFRKEQRTLENGKVLTGLAWQGFDFGLLQRFAFSIVIRAALYYQSKHGQPFCPELELDRLIQVFLSDESADDETYPILIERLVQVPEKSEAGMIGPGTDQEHRPIVHFRGAGYDFIIYASSIPKAPWIRSLSLRKDGTIFTPAVSFLKSSATLASFQSMREAGKKRRSKRQNQRLSKPKK